MAAKQLAMDVIANNLANVNTTGFKKSSGVSGLDVLDLEAGRRDIIKGLERSNRHSSRTRHRTSAIPGTSLKAISFRLTMRQT